MGKDVPCGSEIRQGLDGVLGSSSDVLFEVRDHIIALGPVPVGASAILKRLRHQRVDGSGRNRGYRGEQSPELVRITLALATRRAGYQFSSDSAEPVDLDDRAE